MTRKVTRLLLIGALCVTYTGCNKAADERSAAARREILRGEDLAQKRQQAMAERQVTTDKGELIASKTEIAGITLPRGFQPKFVFDHEWYYDGPLPFAKLENYFRAQLDAGIQPINARSMLFAHARVKGKPDMAPVAVTILQLPGRPDWSRIQILAARPEKTPNPEQVQAELTASRHSNE